MAIFTNTVSTIMSKFHSLINSKHKYMLCHSSYFGHILHITKFVQYMVKVKMTLFLTKYHTIKICLLFN